ncbi:hypothetical protein [Hymenobacter jejuensis]|uniref:DUF11 domain-containing protein n=1 Tax=Hymenobacter jejuensis TaxID=2502781 RepID=A0A5B8A3F8_9BACT|nr:hypothetical protein [Hymenobacter jejuensis]QDA61206.1 hypothetical protein FHG12_14340 [Hymenobacter jejuensis]
MTYYKTLRGSLLLLLAGAGLAGCEKEIDTYYTEVGGQIPTFLANALGTTTKYATGETVTFELQYAQQTSMLKDVRIYQRIEPSTDSTLVQTVPYRSTFSRTKNADTLVVTYVVPQGVNKANVRVSAIATAENGQSKVRAFTYRLAEPTPTVRINSATNVTAPGTSTPVPGDVVRYNLTLNNGGITSATSLTTAGTLYKDIDSLITYVTVGTQAERRYLRQRVPTAGTQTGAATTLDVPVTIPSSTSGQAVLFRFEVKSRFAGTPNFRASSATSAVVTPGTTTSLAAVRAATLAFTGTTGGDQAAFDLTSFTAVAAASPADTKDVAITSIASNAVQIKALNTTKFVKTTAAIYNAATLNSIRQTYLNAATTAQVATVDGVLVGDVYIARLRNADQYAIFTVTGITRTTSGVSLTMDVKAL